MWKFVDGKIHPYWNFICSKEFNKAFISHIDEMLSERFSSNLEMQITKPTQETMSVLGLKLVSEKYKTIRYANWTYKPNFLNTEIVENVDNIKINICERDLAQTRLFLAGMNHELISNGFKDIWQNGVTFWTNHG